LGAHGASEKGIGMQEILEKTVDEAVYPCRLVTRDEIAHYREFGWVKLKQFVHPEMIRTILGAAQGRMGEDGDGNDSYGTDTPYFNAEYGGGLDHPVMRPFMQAAAVSAKALLAREDGTGIRYLTDFFAPKLPTGAVTRNAGNGPTNFHQDFVTFAVDRTGGMTFWIALGNYGPKAGTMHFINRSHRLGVIGNYSNYGGRDIRDAYPELRQLEMSDQMTYEIGDITVHSHLTTHGAEPNYTDKPRWAYLMVLQPADIYWTGAPPEAFDTTGMVPNEQFPDDRFPVLAP
jgi:hypothetical protein